MVVLTGMAPFNLIIIITTGTAYVRFGQTPAPYGCRVNYRVFSPSFLLVDARLANAEPEVGQNFSPHY